MNNLSSLSIELDEDTSQDRASLDNDFFSPEDRRFEKKEDDSDDARPSFIDSMRKSVRGMRLTNEEEALTLTFVAHYAMDALLKLKPEITLNETKITELSEQLKKIHSGQNKPVAKEESFDKEIIDRAEDICGKYWDVIIDYLSTLGIDKSAARQVIIAWLATSANDSDEAIQFIKHMKLCALENQLRAYFSTQRDIDYSLQLQNDLESKLFDLTCLERYADLVDRVAKDVTAGMSSDKVAEIVTKILEKECESYSDRLNTNSKDEVKIKDYLQRMRSYLTDQIKKEKLISLLTNQPEKDLLLFRQVAEDEMYNTANMNTAVQSLLSEHEAAVQDAVKQLNRNTLVKKQRSRSSSPEMRRIAVEKVNVDARDKKGATLLSKTIQYENIELIGKALAHENAPHREDNTSRVALVIYKALATMVDEKGVITNPRGLLYLAVQQNCLFDSKVVEAILELPPPIARQLFPDDSSPETSSDDSSKVKTLFDEQNHFISSPQFIEYVIRNADIEIFQLLMNNIVKQKGTACHAVMSDYLKSAVNFGRCAHIAKILTFANEYQCAESLMRETLFAVKDDEKQLANLIAGAYLFKSTYGGFELKYGGLFNEVFFQRVRSAYVETADDIGAATQIPSKSHCYIQAQKEFDTTCSMLVKKHKEKTLFTLSDRQLTHINEKLLEFADDEALAHFIQEAGSGTWPHNMPDRAQVIREELKKRYVGEGKPALPPKVKAALQQNWNVSQDADKLAAYYDTATRHIVEQYQSDPTLYAGKAQTMLFWTNDIAAKRLADSLTEKAETLAGQLLQVNQNIHKRTPGVAPDLHKYNRTQRLVKAARDELGKKPSMWSTAKRSIGSVVDAVMGWNHQRDKHILEQENIQLGNCLSIEQLYAIPITRQEKEAHIKRAVLARGAFKKTLDYLENSSNGEKLKKLNTYLQHYIDGYDEKGLAYGKDHLKEDISVASQKDGLLGKREFWSGMWPSSPSKTGRMVKADLGKLEKLEEMTEAPAMAS